MEIKSIKKTDDCVGSSFINKKVEEFREMELDISGNRNDEVEDLIRQALQEQVEDIFKCIPGEKKGFEGELGYDELGFNDCRDQLITNLKKADYSVE
jgi:hypothetical protein